MAQRWVGLWRHGDFLKLWAGQTVSLFGSQITLLALPLLAESLGANAAQMGVLNAAGYAPFLVITLFAGVLVDRSRRRPILILADAGRVAILLLLAVLAFTRILNVEHLFVITFLMGIFTVFFQLAYQSYLPSLVRRAQLVEGNSKLGASESVAEIGGPAVAGLLVDILSAPFALFIDAVSFLISAFSLTLIRTPENTPRQPEAQENVARDIAEGFRHTLKDPYLRATAIEIGFYHLFNQIIEAVLILYAIRYLGFSAAGIGILFAIGSIGAFIGAVFIPSLADRVGFGVSTMTALIVACLSALLLPMATPQTAWAVLGLSFFFGWAGGVAYTVQVVSLRQAITPDAMRGRMNASFGFLTWGMMPLGALLGGFLGETIGLYNALTIGAMGMSTLWVWVIFSPLPYLRALPETEPEPEPTLPIWTPDSTTIMVKPIDLDVSIVPVKKAVSINVVE